MVYDFKNLSPADFEELTISLLSKALGVHLEAFVAGPDGGIDGRHAKDLNHLIVQAKHYANSSFSQMKAAIKKERSKIDDLKPTRYILVTSQGLTPHKKKKS